MTYLYLAALIAGLMLAVRIMFFGAERRKRASRAPDGMPLRRSEPAGVAFLVMFGMAGYLFTRAGALSALAGVGVAALLGVIWAAIVVRIAIAMARLQPEHDPEDPRYLLQGHVALVTRAIPDQGEGTITFDDGSGSRSSRARAIDGSAIEEELEVCIERVEDEVAFVERWEMVEARL